MSSSPQLHSLPQVYAHRGGAGSYPENSIEAFLYATTLGVDFIDMDVLLNKDNEVIVIHDPTLQSSFVRNSDMQFVPQNKHHVLNMSIDDLKTFDIGMINPNSKKHQEFPDVVSTSPCKIPTLDEALQTILPHKNQIGIQIEVKSKPSSPHLFLSAKTAAEKICSLIKLHKIEEICEVQSFDWNVLQSIQEIEPKVKTAYLVPDPEIDPLFEFDQTYTIDMDLSKVPISEYPQIIKKLGGSIFGPEHTLVNEKLVQNAKKWGVKLVPWTADEVKEMQRLIDLGVDGIITNYPKKLIKLLRQRRCD